LRSTDKRNLLQDAPSENSHTKIFRNWATETQLPIVDRMEMNVHLESWKMYDKQICEIENELVKRAEANPKKLYKLITIPGISPMGAITLLSRIGDITRFKNPRSLANYFGLTPGCHNSAGKQRVGGITKAGSVAARNVLNFAVNHIVRKDNAMKQWHKKIKTRRGAKTARVAVMRKLATIIWHMLRWDKDYCFHYDPPTVPKKRAGRGPARKVFGGMGNNNRAERKTSLKHKNVTRT
jgi:transposase